jgi:hypothetical protein
MSKDVSQMHPDEYEPPTEDELGLALGRDWTAEEESKAKRK